MKPNRSTFEILDEISDLNMASFYRDEFKMWRGGEVKFLGDEGDYMGVARFANVRGFVVPKRHYQGGLPLLSRKGADLLGMDARQNGGRWRMLVDTLKGLGK